MSDDWNSEVSLARRKLRALARIAIDGYAETWFGSRVMGDAMDLVVRHARGFSDGIRRLVVELPTQKGKTLHTALMACEAMGQDASMRVQDCGYGNDFISMASRYVKTIGDSDGFAQAFPRVRLGKPKPIKGRKRADAPEVDDNVGDTIHHIDTMKLVGVGTGQWIRGGGFFRARSVRGQVNGFPYDIGILDDPYKGWDGEAGALNAGWNAKLRNFYGSVFRMRQQSSRSCEVLAFTPWTPDDIREYIISRWDLEGDPYLVLKFPLKQRGGPPVGDRVSRPAQNGDYPEERSKLLGSKPAQRGLARLLGISWEALNAAILSGGACRPYDPRAPGEGLDLVRDTQEEHDKKFLGSTLRDYAALCDLAPSGEAINRFPKEWFRGFDPSDTPVSSMSKVIISIDPNGKERGNSFACGGVWGLKKPPADSRLRWLSYRMDEFRERPGYSDLKDLIRSYARRWPEARDILIERKAHGGSLAEDRDFINHPDFSGRTLHFLDKNDSKGDCWDLAETPIRTGGVHLPLRPTDESLADPRITWSWVHDAPGAAPEEVASGDKMGYLSEMAGAGRVARDDRPDETAQLLNWAEDAAGDGAAWDKLGSMNFGSWG